MYHQTKRLEKKGNPVNMIVQADFKEYTYVEAEDNDFSSKARSKTERGESDKEIQRL